MRFRNHAAGLAAALCVTTPTEASAQAAPVPMTPSIERLGTLRSPRLGESSGIAVSRAHPGLLWTHNDSGDSATVYAINQAGDLLGIYPVVGAGAVDWEDLALGPCPEAPGDCLYIADTGDNEERRRAVVLYVVPEPAAPAGEPGGMIRTDPARRLRITYPDAPHDVEALAVDPAGDVYLITKGRTSPVRVFRVPRTAFRRDTTTAVLVDTLAITPLQQVGRWVTGAAFSPSGNRLVVRTYTELFFFRRRDGRFVADGASCWLGAAEPQGEGVDFLDEETLILTSESTANQLGPVLRVRCITPGATR